MSDVRAAAESLRDHAWLERFRKANYDNSFNLLSPTACNDIARYVDKFIDTVLAEHPADDDVEHPADENEPVTEEFVVSLKPPRYWEAGCEYAWPDVGLRYAVKIGDGRPPVLAAGFYLDAASGPVYLRHIKTRGEARALLEALGVSHG